MPPRKLYFESLRVGDELPAMAKAPIDRVQLARFAGAVNDYNPLHVDENHARTIGMPSVYAPPGLGMAFLGQLVSDWGRGSTVKKITVKFIKLLWPGDTLVCKGRVSDRIGEGGKYSVELDVWAENQKGELVLKGTCLVQVFYSPEDENRQRSGQPPVVVEVKSVKAPPPPAPTAPAGKPGKPSKKKPAPKAKPAKKKKK